MSKRKWNPKHNLNRRLNYVHRVPDKRKDRESYLTDDMILSYLAKGGYLKEIMHATKLSENQVGYRLNQIYKKHGVADRVSLLVKTGRVVVVEWLVFKTKL